MKETVLKICIHVIAAIALVAFILPRFEATKAWFFVPEGFFGNNGDLYRISQLDHFTSSEKPPRTEEPDVLLPDAHIDPDIIIVGDSFSRANFGHPSMSQAIASSTDGVTVRSEVRYDPIRAVQKELRQKDLSKRRTVVFIQVDRHITSKMVPEINTQWSLPAVAEGPIRQRWFTDSERQLSYGFQFSRVTQPLYHSLTNIRYNVLGVLPSQAPEHMDDMLFYDLSVQHGNLSVDDATMDTIAQRIKRMQDVLDKQYNANFVFVFVPNKYTVYRDSATSRPADSQFYATLLTRLQDKNVRVIDLLTPLQEKRKQHPGQLLYWKNDTHWNINGATLVNALVVNEIKAILNTP